MVMGTLNQCGETGSLLRGNTAEQVIGSVEVMVCNEFTTTKATETRISDQAEGP